MTLLKASSVPYQADMKLSWQETLMPRQVQHMKTSVLLWVNLEKVKLTTQE